jgi:hypothetical protein
MDNFTKYYWTPSGGVSIDDFLKKVSILAERELTAVQTLSPRLDRRAGE